MALLFVSIGLTFAQAPPTTLDSSRDFEVFQRQTRSQGTVLGAGRTTVDCDQVEGRLEPPAPWQALALDPNRDLSIASCTLRPPAGTFRGSDPNGPASPKWPAYNGGDAFEVMHFGSDSKALPDDCQNAIHFSTVSAFTNKHGP